MWIDEVNNSFLNTYLSYVKDWTIAPEPFGIRLALQPTLAFGSRDIYLEPEAILFFGRRNEIGKSTAYNRLGSVDREIYFALRASYRSVFIMALLKETCLVIIHLY